MSSSTKSKMGYRNKASYRGSTPASNKSIPIRQYVNTRITLPMLVICAEFTWTLPVQYRCFHKPKKPVETCRKAVVNLPQSKAKDRK